MTANRSTFSVLAELGQIGLFIGPVILAALLLVWQERMEEVAAPEVATGPSSAG